MSDINLYKISNLNELKKKIKNKKFKKKNETRKIEIREGDTKETYLMTLYYHKNEEDKELPWKNFALKFDFTPPNMPPRPNAIILIEKDKTFYGISFGSAYHYIDPYCDKEWAFEFAKRMDYSKVNLIATTIPQSKLNKQSSTYINYNSININTGEALNKIAAYINSEEESFDFNNKIQAGNSIKFKLKKDNLETIAKTISYVEKIIASEEIHHEFPAMKEIKDEKRISELNQALLDELEKIIDNPSSNDYIDINSYISYTTKTVEIDEFESFELIYNSESKKLVDLNINEVIKFIKFHKIDFKNCLQIKINIGNENPPLTKLLYQLIIFDCIWENSIYENGKWQEYNECYVHMIEEEVKTISAEYCPEYSFYSDEYEKYLSKRSNSDDENFKNRKGYYNETTFNEYLRDCHNYEYYDKELKEEKGYYVELMDLYKDKTAYSVKKGSASSNLAYVIDQCIKGLESIRTGEIKFDKKIETVCIWIILERETKIHDDETNTANINELNMIIFKNRLVAWKKQMLLWNYKPVIRVNYKSKNKEKFSN